MAESFKGPDDLIAEVQRARVRSMWRAGTCGDLSDAGLARLVRIAYNASIISNEGRYPKLTMVVCAAKGKTLAPSLPLEGELTLSLLRRLAPCVRHRNAGLLVEERNSKLLVVGVATLEGNLTRFNWGDPNTRSFLRPMGLRLSIEAPGCLRVAEEFAFRLRGGEITEERSFVFDKWFKHRYEEAARRLLPPNSLEQTIRSGGLAICSVWMGLLAQVSDVGHGGCLVLLQGGKAACLKEGFMSSCELGRKVVELHESVPRDFVEESENLNAAFDLGDRMFLREHLQAAIDGIAQMSATDGCVVFDEQFGLRSFGSMIEGGDVEDVPCVDAQTMVPLEDDRVRSFGARRASALRLCQHCPDSIAFVMSQDGELRIFVREGQAVQFYDDATLW